MTLQEYDRLMFQRGVTAVERLALKEVMQEKPPMEDEEQAALVVWLQQRGIRHHHSPNGGLRHKAVAKKLKVQGVSPGFPDLIIFPNPDSDLPLLFIELKRTKGGTVSEDQKAWLEYFDSLTHIRVATAVCRGFEEARKFILSHGY